MKKNGIIFILIALIAIVGCGGHGYEGEYKIEGGGGFGEIVGAAAEMVGSSRIEVGSNYIEANGERSEFEKIFVRESGGQKYLVFKGKETEEAWKIIDKDTLMQGNEFLSLKLKRIRK